MENQASKMGRYYEAAGGEKIYNEGETSPVFFTANGECKGMKFQVAKVGKH